MAFLTREQLEERLVSLHHASLELVGELSLETVLERIVQIAKEEVNATYAALGVFDDEGKLVKFIPIGPNTEEYVQTHALPSGKGLLGALKTERKTIRVANIQEDKRSVGFPDWHPIMHSFLGVPILLGDQLLGQIYLTDKIKFPEFTEDDERVIETLAAYAAVAINNARLYSEITKREEALQSRNEDLELVNNIATALTSSLDIDAILDKTLRSVVGYIGVESGEIFLIGDDNKEYKLAFHYGNYGTSFFTREIFHLGEGLVGEVAQESKSIFSLDLGREVRFVRQEVFEEGCRWMAGIPLLARGSVIAVMVLANSAEVKLETRQANLLKSISSWAGITIENAILHSQARQLAVLEERERIGMDLHDGIIQSIYGVGLALEYARISLEDDPEQAKQKIIQAIDNLNKTIRDIRAYILDLRPRELFGNNLIQNLNRLVDEYRVNTLSGVTLSAPDDGLVGLPISHATALFHICQEALANAAKHARAQQVDVRLWSTRDRVLLEIADNGEGFDIHKMSVTLGHGLSNMHVRARKVGGDVEVTSEPGEGTTVLAWVPRRG